MLNLSEVKLTISKCISFLGDGSNERCKQLKQNKLLIDKSLERFQSQDIKQAQHLFFLHSKNTSLFFFFRFLYTWYNSISIVIKSNGRWLTKFLHTWLKGNNSNSYTCKCITSSKINNYKIYQTKQVLLIDKMSCILLFET